VQVTSGTVRNYRGWAEVLSGTYSAGTRGNASYEINYTRPLSNPRTAFSLSAFQTTNDYSAYSSHIEILRGAIANYMVSENRHTQHS
jgi:hemolysin activation/secretion protein